MNAMGIGLVAPLIVGEKVVSTGSRLESVFVMTYCFLGISLRPNSRDTNDSRLLLPHIKK